MEFTSLHKCWFGQKVRSGFSVRCYTKTKTKFLAKSVHQEYIYKWNNCTEHLLNTSGGPRTPKRTRKIPMQLDRMKEKKKKRGNGLGPAHQGGELKERRGSHTKGSPLTAGRPAGTEKELQGIGGESSKKSVEDRAE